MTPSNPEDPKELYKNLAIKRIINLPKRGIGNKTMELIETQAEHDDTNMYEIIKNYAGKRDLSEESMEQLEQFQKDMRGADVNIFTAAQIRMLDQIFQENLHPSYSVVIKDKSHDLAVSGLSLAIQDESFLNHLFPKTIILQVKDTIGKEQKALVEKVADANYVRLDECFTISGKK